MKEKKGMRCSKQTEQTMCHPHSKESEQHFGPKFRTIHHMINRYFGRCWENDERELTRAQCATIHYLYDRRQENVFQKDIEAFFSISGATATNILKGLERQGILVRVSMEEDARLKRILLTEAGIEIHKKALGMMEQMEMTLTEGMTEEEITTYRYLLSHTIQNLEKLMGESEKYLGEKS